MFLSTNLGKSEVELLLPPGPAIVDFLAISWKKFFGKIKKVLKSWKTRAWNEEHDKEDKEEKIPWMKDVETRSGSTLTWSLSLPFCRPMGVDFRSISRKVKVLMKEKKMKSSGNWAVIGQFGWLDL